MLFSDLSEVFEKLYNTSKRLELTADIAALYGKADPGAVRKLTYLCQGILAPEHSGIELGIGEKLAMQSIALISGKSLKDVEKSYRKTGDLGDTSQELLQKKQQHSLASEELTVDKVYDKLYKIATSSGQGSQDVKIKILAELLNSGSAVEGKYIVRLVTGNLRLGVAEATLLDAWSTVLSGDKSLRAEIERAFNYTSDLGMVAEILFAQGGMEELKKIKPTPFSPIRPALAERLNTPEELFAKLGSCTVEGKYDGLRVQVHKKGKEIMIFTRRQEVVTRMFPDIVQAAKEIDLDTVIFEGEAIGFDEKTGKFLNFQSTIQRRRKENIGAKALEIPLKVLVFELLLADNEDLTAKPYAERRELIKKHFGKEQMLQPSLAIHAESALDIQEFFESCLAKGLEGVIAKDDKAPYTAGARKFAWIKIKKSYQSDLADTVDVVIIGYYLGKGKRTEFGLGGILCAIYDAKSNTFKSIAKVGTGFSEEQLKQFQERLEKIKIPKKAANVDSVMDADVWVKPHVVVTVNADEITRSPVHTCARVGEEGLALRFPRLVEIREDKAPEDATTEEEVLELFELQQGNKS